MQEEQIQTLQREVALLARQVDEPQAYRELVASQLASIRAEMREELARNVLPAATGPSDETVEERVTQVRETLLDLPRNAALARDAMESVGRSFSSQETMRAVPRDLRRAISRTLFPRPEETTHLRAGDPVPEWRRWKLVKPLGRGGFGEVWLATHEINGRLVAVKFADDPTKAEQLEREIEAVRRLSHPHIVPLEDADLEAKPPWIGFEYVSGGTLTQWIRETPRSIDEIVRRLDEVLQALAHAHEQGVWHRDVKPDNVLIDANGRALLTDFGIGKVIAEERQRLVSQSLGLSMTISGTTMYMAPEVLNAQKPADARSDVYAFGVLAWQLFLGDPTTVLSMDCMEDLQDVDGVRFEPFLRRCLARYERRFEHAVQALEEFRSVPLRRHGGGMLAVSESPSPVPPGSSERETESHGQKMAARTPTPGATEGLKMRVYEIAREHGVDAQRLVAQLQASGLHRVKNHMSVLVDSDLLQARTIASAEATGAEHREDPLTVSAREPAYIDPITGGDRTFQFKLPDIGEGIAEGEVVKWHVAVGDVVHEGDSLVEVMTDKATVEIPSPKSGRILALAVVEGAVVPVGATLLTLEEDPSLFAFQLPDIGEGIAEGEVVLWHVSVGDVVHEGDPLVEVMTDKATVEISSPKSGRVLELKASEGAVVPVGATLLTLVIDVDDEDDEEEVPSEIADPW